MRQHIFVRLVLVGLLLTLLPAPSATAGPLDREIARLEQELSTLETNLRQGMEFRARYRNLKADLAFYEALSRQDDVLLQKLLAYLNTPLSIFDAFLSQETSSYEAAERAKWRYSPGRTTLWIKCRFGLQAIKTQAYYTVRADVVDAQSGDRIFQSLGPWQRRTAKLIEKIPIALGGIKVAAGRYQIRVTVEVSGKSTSQLIPFAVGQGASPAPGPPPSRTPPPGAAAGSILSATSEGQIGPSSGKSSTRPGEHEDPHEHRDQETARHHDHRSRHPIGQALLPGEPLRDPLDPALPRGLHCTTCGRLVPAPLSIVLLVLGVVRHGGIHTWRGRACKAERAAQAPEEVSRNRREQPRMQGAGGPGNRSPVKSVEDSREDPRRRRRGAQQIDGHLFRRFREAHETPRRIQSHPERRRRRSVTLGCAGGCRAFPGQDRQRDPAQEGADPNAGGGDPPRPGLIDTDPGPRHGRRPDRPIPRACLPPPRRRARRPPGTGPTRALRCSPAHGASRPKASR